MIQKTKWGYIDWWYLSENGEDRREDRRSMNVGVTYIIPGMSQSPHIHYGHEQLLYVLQGEGLYNINGKEVPFGPGMHFYMEADTLHDTINTGKSVVRELLISNPVSYYSPLSNPAAYYGSLLPSGQASSEFDGKTSGESDGKASDESDGKASGESDGQASGESDGKLPGEATHVQVNLYAAVEAVRSQLLEAVRFPFTIFDENWEIVMQNQRFPKQCMEQCGSNKYFKRCSCMQKRVFDTSRTSSCTEFNCPYGMTIYHYDVIFKGEIIGAVRGGHFFSSDEGSQVSGEVYDTPKSTGIGIQRSIRQMVDSIQSYCEFYVSREILHEKEQTLQRTEQRRIRLEQDLTDVKETVTNLKINHHFLFNTLNSMAGMALTGAGDELYGAIVDLAKMFRYTMASNLRFVELHSELEYLGTYLNLQRLRYKDKLFVDIDVKEECSRIPVPFNFLQPIVENAFTHGFLSNGEKRIRIEVKRDHEYVVCSCYNNGLIPDEVTVNRIQKSLCNNSGHGLALIYAKLKSAYGADFQMKITVEPEAGTCVGVRLPIYESEN